MVAQTLEAVSALQVLAYHISSGSVTLSAAESGTSGASEAMTLTTGDVANSNSYSLTTETKNLHV